jgi:hypothetical protein
MSISRQKELISVCWLIAAIIAFGNGEAVLGWICLIKSLIDIFHAVKKAGATDKEK